MVSRLLTISASTRPLSVSLISQTLSTKPSGTPSPRSSEPSFASGRLLVLVALVAGLLALAAPSPAQQPLPYTITTVAGGGATSTGSASTPVACATGSPYNSYDVYGNGCPGLLTNFSSDLRGGVASDGEGNIYIADTSNSMIRKYDPKTGIVSRVAGKGTDCTTGLLDSSGDGCPALQTSFASTPRGIATDPYGNVLFAGYGTEMVHVICMAASPLCPNTTGLKQIGYMYRIAGCVATAGSTATAAPTGNTILDTWAGTEGDNSFASPYNNLAGDASAGTTGIAGNGSCPGTNTNSGVGVLNQPRGVAADQYGNVYIAETGTTGAGLRYRVVLGPQTSSYFTGNNPMWVIIDGAAYTSTAGNGTYTAQQGYIYTILGGFTGTPAAAGGTCGAFTSEDAKGDGCPFYFSSANGGVQGVAVDNYGNVIFSDTINSLVRVLYAGGAGNPLATAIVNNSGGTVTTPVAGNVYLLAGGGGTNPSAAPALGSSLVLPNEVWKVTVGPGGNLYLGDSSASQVFYYNVTTGYLQVLFKSGTPCAASVVGSANGDGCPANSFSVSGSNGFGVAVGPLGNLYVADSTNKLIREVEAVSLIPTIVGSNTAAGTPLTQTLTFHGPVGTASMTATALNNPADITVGAVTCGAANADATLDCTVPVTFTPIQPGTRTLDLAVTASSAAPATLSSKVFAVSGTGYGTALVADVASPATAVVAGTTNPVGAAFDGADNLYTNDTLAEGTGEIIKYNVAAATSIMVGVPPTSLRQLAVDDAGNVYATSTGSASITEYVLNPDGTYTSTTLTNPAIASPHAVAIDPSGNLFVGDAATGNVYEVPAGTAFNTAQATTSIASGIANPVSMTFDGLGNLFVADSSKSAIYKIANVNGVYTTSLYAADSSKSPTVAVPGLNPLAIAADAAGDVYVQDSTSKDVLEIPVSQAGPTTTTVLTGLNTPTGLAVDGNGVVYSADYGAGDITQVLRNAAALAFGTNTSETLGATYINAGNLSATGFQTAGQDSTEFPLTSVSPSNCFANTTITPGYACSVTSQFTPSSGTGNVASMLAFTPASSTTGSLTLSGTKTGATVNTTTTIGTQTPASPIYSAAGTEVTFPVTVTASDSSTPTGYVNITIDINAPVAYTLSGGVVSVPLSGLAAGPHTITAAYPSQNGIIGSSTNTPVNFSIAQATTTTNWSPATTTQQYSAAIGNGVLDAAAVVTGTSTSVPGYYLYTATPGGGSAATIHAASFLAIGTYALNVTFVPTDTVDFAQSTASVATYTVTQATTTAPIGATQMLVASDGTGNFTSVQTAVNAIPATGGALYIAPGTYTGDVAVVQPNTSFFGLGGDPTKVIITHASGAFGGSGTYAYAGEFNSSITNGSQLPANSTLFNGDEGSATLVVAKGINTAVSGSDLIPNNFYADNLTLVNTYDSDTTTTTTTYLPASNSGACTANQGPSQTYNYLFENGLECASQALAIWITSDLGVMNNVYTTSLQDTIYAGSQGSGGSGYVPARQYWFRGKVTGAVDYIFGDAAAVFDYSSIYTLPHGANASITGTATIEAQNKAVETGSASDYLSGYIMNSNVFTSLINGQTGLYFGRPYGQYSTWIMLNSYVDQVNPLGYFEFSSSTNNLPTSTYTEYNDIPYTDPATNSPDLNGVAYLGTGGASGAGVTGARETVSQDPGTAMAANAIKTSMTASQVTLYYPAAFLGSTVSNSSTGVTNWNPTAALAAGANAFVPPGTSATVAGGSSVTLLMRPQTPGLGAVTNGVYTIPTGTYTLTDDFNGTPSVIASGTLDASGEAYFTSSSLAAGTHNLSWTYSGDSNFSGSTTASAYVLTVTGSSSSTTTTINVPAPNAVVYGAPAPVTVDVTSTGGTPTGAVTLTVNGTTTYITTLSGGVATFSLANLTAGIYSLNASYSGATAFAPSATSSSSSLVVNQAPLTITAVCANRIFDQPNSCGAMVSGYAYTDSAANVFTATPTATTTATQTSPANTYATMPVYTLSAFGSTNYSVTPADGTFSVTGGAPQSILFAPLPNLPVGTYQLTAHTTSGLPVTYTITGGNATVSGSTLTVTGSGLITVQASQSTDPSGDYAPATPVSQSFTAP